MNKEAIRIENLTWIEVEKIISSDTIVIFAIGARTKEHGPHLPLNNDYILAESLIDMIKTHINGIIIPTIQYGYYPAFLEYPGSISISSNTFRDMIIDICKSMNGYGPYKFYIVNTGISTLNPLGEAKKTLKSMGIILKFLNLLDFDKTLPQDIFQQEGGTHADEIETSMMLYLAPDIVKMKLAVKDFDARPGLKGLSRIKTEKKHYSATGIYGDPTLANRDKGEFIVNRLVKYITEEINNMS